MDEQKQIALHVIKHNEQWAVKEDEDGIPVFVYSTKIEAITKVKELAIGGNKKYVIHADPDEHEQDNHAHSEANGEEHHHNNSWKFIVTPHEKGWAVVPEKTGHPTFIYAIVGDAIEKAKELAFLYDTDYQVKK